MLELGFKNLLAYLLGSVIGSLLVGRLRGGVDIRTQGSGNAGGTNALRTQGPWFAAWVMLIDVGKGFIAVTVVPALSLPGIPADPLVSRDWLAVTCAISVVLGHVYPLWHEFRGGKGAATLVGVLAGIAPLALAPVLGVWLVTVLLSGYVGLGTMLAACAFPVFLAITQAFAATPVMALALSMTVFVAYTHRSNIKRMWAGSESRARSLWLLRPR
ncbi:MAG: glycerol-3-phosphate 1-O-acyltransferase PlsY [Steroidobacteraceae bacterium]